MKLSKYAALIVLVNTTAFAETKFLLGDGSDQWGVPLKVPDSDLTLRFGARIQGLATLKTEERASQDFQARRVRFLFRADLGEKGYFSMDLRNDNANQKDEGEQDFNVGSAFVHLPLIDTKTYTADLRLYRAKVDLSRAQTVSSSEVLFVSRPKVTDGAANFVTHNRRATNVQLNGTLFDKASYQIVVGDGVQSKEFEDAKTNTIAKIDRQNFMIGGKLRFFPIEGWEDQKLTETYFGEGKHFSFGVGLFNTSNIFIENDSSVSDKVSRNLTNLEISGHYKDYTLIAEYFSMDGVIEDHETTTRFNKGKGEGWYVQGEKVFPHFHYLAPFVRYENWDRFVTSGDYLTTDQMYGMNWYLNGNRLKVSVAYAVTTNGDDTELENRSEAYHIASAWIF